ncbi:MAG: hypothetical protein IPH12_22390 [Saprospirales bacterium]|nr:hypothetical protein [Saprospirales bacterium]
MPDGYHFEGYHFDGNQFHFEGLEGGLQGKYRPEITEEEIRRAHDAALRELEQQRKEIEKALREQERTWKKDRKAWSKQQREQRRALEEAQREMQQRQWQQIEQEMAAEMAQARTLQQARAEQHTAESTSSALKNALLADKLITDPDNYSLELTGKEMRVNGKKQPADTHKRYLEIYRQKTGKDLGSGKVRIEVEN